MFSLKITENIYTQVEGNFIPLSTDLGYQLWDPNDLPKLSTEFISRRLSSSLYWPQNKSYRVAGNYLSESMHFISINIKRWQGTGWKSTKEIDNVINKAVFSILILNSYMDFNDYENPVKSYIDDRVSFFLQPSQCKYIKMYAKLNKATLDDDYLKLKPSIEREFFNVERVQNDSIMDNENIVDGKIYMDPNRDFYQRSVFSILDLFGLIGGIFGLLTSTWGLAVGIISAQIMLSSVFKRLYYNNKTSAN